MSVGRRPARRCGWRADRAVPFAPSWIDRLRLRNSWVAEVSQEIDPQSRVPHPSSQRRPGSSPVTQVSGAGPADPMFRKWGCQSANPAEGHPHPQDLVVLPGSDLLVMARLLGTIPGLPQLGGELVDDGIGHAEIVFGDFEWMY